MNVCCEIFTGGSSVWRGYNIHDMRLLDFLICDDVRYEVGGKISLVGVYADGITVSSQNGPVIWPIGLPKIGFFVRIQLEETDFRPERFVMSALHNGNLVGRYEGEVSISDSATHLTLALSATSFPLPAPGALSCAIELSKGEKSVTLEPRLGTPVRMQ